jgi:hypothetical protein
MLSQLSKDINLAKKKKESEKKKFTKFQASKKIAHIPPTLKLTSCLP